MGELIFERRAEDNKYLHKDFHASINNAIDYVGKKFGENAVKEYLRKYVFSRYKKMSLEEAKKYFENIYEAEESSDALFAQLDNDCLFVKIAYSPGIKYLKEFNEKISEWYYLADTYLYECLAELCDFVYCPISYNSETGACEFTLRKKDL